MVAEPVPGPGVSLRLRDKEGMGMRDVRKFGLMVLAPIAGAWAIPAQAQTEFTGAGQTSEIHCNGGGVRIEGASNTLTVRGACTTLTVMGAGNRITVDLAARSLIRVEGADNQIEWSAPGTAKPVVRVVGTGNRVARRP